MSSLRRLMSAWRASHQRLRRKLGVQSRSKTSFGKFVRVAITRFDLDPTIFDGFAQPSTEIGISHVDEIIASKYAARINFMLHENAENLPSYFFIRCHVVHPLRVSKRRCGRCMQACQEVGSGGSTAFHHNGSPRAHTSRGGGHVGSARAALTT